MNQRSRWGLVWLFLLIWPLQLCAGATAGSLNDENINLVNPLTTTATPLNDTTLTSVIGAIGSARQNILIALGTWTIADDLTVPANVGLYLAPEAQFSINSGRTLTINGPLHAERRTIFSGAGDVRFGAQVEAVHPHWFGAACDGMGNDQPALQKAIGSAATGTYHVLEFPSSTCRITAQLNLLQGLRIIGPSSEGGRIVVAGAGVKGLVYTSASVIEANIVIENLSIDGEDLTVGNLIEISGTGAGFVAEVTLKNVRLRNGGASGLYLDRTLQVRSYDTRIGNVTASGIYYRNSNTGTFISTNINAHPTAAHSAFRCEASSHFTVINPVLEGGSVSTSGYHFNGCGDATIIEGFCEFFADCARGETTASDNLKFIGGHYHSGTGQVAFDFSAGSLAHTRIQVTGVTCVVADRGYCFKGVETIASMHYCYNAKAHLGGGSSTHFNPATVSPNVDCLRKGYNEVIDGLRITDLTGAFPVPDGTITRLITTADSWDFTGIAKGTCETLTKTLPGAATTDYAVALIPNRLHTVGITYSTEISAADTIAIKRCNNGGRAAPDPAPTFIKFIVMKVTNIQ